MAVDQWNYIYVAGAYEVGPSSSGFSLPPSVSWGVLNPNLAVCNAYLTKYRRELGQTPPLNNLATIEPVGAVNPGNPFYVTIKKMEVDRNGNIHVMGEFLAEEIEFYDQSSNFKLNATTAFPSSPWRKVFIASFDSTFSAYSCHTIVSQDHDVFAGDIALGYYDVQPGPSLYYTVSCKGSLLTEQFGGGMPPVVPYDNYPLPNPSDYDVFVGKLELATNQVIDGTVITGEGDDFAAELASGYQGYYASESALFLSGAFSGDLEVNDPILGSVTHTSQGDFDIFAIKFPDFQLGDQLACVAGGPNRDQALCMADEGYKIGGFMSSSAAFGSAGTAGNFGVSPYPGYIVGGHRQVGFIAEADYDNHDWIWFQDRSVAGLDGAITSIAEDNCGTDFYSSLEYGMHPNVFDITRPLDLNFKGDHLYTTSISGTGTDHSYISILDKWNDTSTGIASVWSYDFAGPTAPFYDGFNIKANFIEDIALFSNLGQDTVDVVFTGRFGHQIDLSAFSFTKPWANPIFDGNVTPNASGPATMFIAALDENPILDTSYYSFCMTDAPGNLSCPIMPTWAGTPSYSMTNLNLQFIGPGITNSTLGTFDPFIAGIGSHEILVFADYFGCGTITPGVVKVEVLEAIYPRHPTTTGAEWAEGLSATGVQRLDLEDTPTSGDYYITYLAGKYYDQISFDKDGGGVITLNAPASQEAGYIVANGPCGALWALNFTSNGNAYIENLELKETYGVDDTEVKPILYAVGGTRGSVSVTNSEIGIQSPAQLSSLSYSSSAIPAANEKGLLCEIDPLTGEVNWMYHGGYYANERNRFHDLAVTESYIAIIGERWGNFTYLSKTSLPVTLSAVSAEDPIMVLLDIDGNAKQTNVIPSTPGFGGPGNDRGDAIDMKVVKAVYAPSGAPITYSAFEAIEIVYGGYMEPGLINYDYTTLLGNNNIPTIEGKNAYLAHSSYDIINDVMINNRFRIIQGDGDDELRDIHLFGQLKHQAFDPAKSDQIFICGKFADRFEPLTANPLVTSGTGDYDIYIGCVNRNLGNRWFTHEGSFIGLNEAANALESKDGILYAYGEAGGNTIISSRHSGLSQTSPSLLNGVGFNPRHTIFSVAFAPNGTLLDQVLTFPWQLGLNQGWDITVVDSMLVSAGTIGLMSGNSFDFFESNGNIHHSLFRNSNTKDAFMGRIAPTNVSYFKTDYETRTTMDDQWVRLYPNPNHGDFNLVFDELYAGELVVRDIQGRVMKTELIQNSLTHSVQLNLAAGVYALQLKNSATSETILFVIE